MNSAVAANLIALSNAASTAVETAVRAAEAEFPAGCAVDVLLSSVQRKPSKARVIGVIARSYGRTVSLYVRVRLESKTLKDVSVGRVQRRDGVTP